jgi:hypothetical protein
VLPVRARGHRQVRNVPVHVLWRDYWYMFSSPRETERL